MGGFGLGVWLLVSSGFGTGAKSSNTRWVDPATATSRFGNGNLTIISVFRNTLPLVDRVLSLPAATGLLCTSISAVSSSSLLIPPSSIVLDLDPLGAAGKSDRIYSGPGMFFVLLEW